MARQIHIRPRPVERREGSLIVSARLDGVRRGRKTLWFQVDESYGSWLTQSAGPWVLAVIFNAMRSGADLVVHGAVSRSLLVNLERFQQVWTRWRPNCYRPVTITAEAEWPDQARQGEAVAGFTGGVDSCFTAYRNRRDLAGGQNLNLTAGLMVLGFDVPLYDRDQFGSVLRKCRRLLRSIGMESLFMATNIREQPINWKDLHGTALAASLSVLAGRFTTGIIASTFPVRRIHPYGSHPLMDPFLGSDGFPIVHDGAECGREEKMRLLAEWPQAMADLRVCWEGRQRDRNCGRCYKCVRTKLCFMVSGLPIPPSLGSPLTESEIRSWRLTDEWQLADIEALIERGRCYGQDQQPWFETLLSLQGLHRRFLVNRLSKFLSVNAPQAILASLRGGGVGLTHWTDEMARTSELEGRPS